jgi:NAD(P)-dependent dehydrogenase (short-subunit alcohol dehydrogenase family)
VTAAFKGRTALVTGAARGIGRAIAAALASQGAAVFAADVSSTTAQLPCTTPIDLDVTDASAVDAALRRIDAQTGGVNILVNNAGVLRAGALPAVTRDQWDEIARVNLESIFFLTQRAAPAMRRAGGGAIVNIASISALWHGRRTPGGAPAFDVAKAGMIRLATTLAGLALTDRIRVNCLAPGWIATDGPRQYWESLTPAERLERGVPSRLLTTAQVADAVVRLATDETLAGRVMLWWSDDEPRLIEWADRGYAAAVDITIT